MPPDQLMCYRLLRICSTQQNGISLARRAGYGPVFLLLMMFTLINFIVIILLHVGILILAISMFPVFVLWVNSEPILLLLQQDPCVARYASMYVHVLIVNVLYLLLQTSYIEFSNFTSIHKRYSLVPRLPVTRRSLGMRIETCSCGCSPVSCGSSFLLLQYLCLLCRLTSQFLLIICLALPVSCVTQP